MTPDRMISAQASETALFAPLFAVTAALLIGLYTVTAPQGGHRYDEVPAKVLRLSTAS